VNRALIDKDAIYTQEGQPVQTASNVVIGAIIAYAGEFGISQNPESFAVYGYRKYFTDKDKGSVLRLSQDGLTEISNYGMYDFFRDQFLDLDSGKAVGGWDIHNKCYTLALNPASTNFTSQTLSFDEGVKGWTSRYSYTPTNMFSVQNNFFSTNSGNIYQHYSTAVNRANFYGVQHETTITAMLNESPSVIKSFNALNYEGTQSNVDQFKTYTDPDGNSWNTLSNYNLNDKKGWKVNYIKTDKQEGFVKEFIEKEGKWFNYIKGNDAVNTSDLSFQGLGTIKEVS